SLQYSPSRYFNDHFNILLHIASTLKLKFDEEKLEKQRQEKFE
ncbi:21246_t:CDS:1, partial [Dentiscutata erythropus]